MLTSLVLAAALTVAPAVAPESTQWGDSNHPVWHSSPGWIRELGKCIRAHESHHNYKAENPHSTASGAYQFLTATWRGNAKWAKWRGEFVARKYKTAGEAPKWVQDVVFIHSIRHGGIKAWNGTWCPGT